MTQAFGGIRHSYVKDQSSTKATDVHMERIATPCNSSLVTSLAQLFTLFSLSQFNLQAMQNGGSLFRALTPYTAYEQNKFSLHTVESLKALKLFKRDGVLSEDLSSNACFYLISYATKNNLPALRQASVDALVKSFSQKRDTLVDYCQALWIVAQSYDVPFLSKEKIAQLRSISNPFSRELGSSICLCEKEKHDLLEAIVARETREDGTHENSTGPILLRDLILFLGNFQSPGAVFRSFAKDAEGIVLRVSTKKDLHPFSMYLPYIVNGKLCPPDVRDQKDAYCMGISRIEVSEDLYQEDEQLSTKLSELQKKNPSLGIKIGIKDYPERVQDKGSEQIRFLDQFVIQKSC